MSLKMITVQKNYEICRLKKRLQKMYKADGQLLDMSFFWVGFAKQKIKHKE